MTPFAEQKNTTQRDRRQLPARRHRHRARNTQHVESWDLVHQTPADDQAGDESDDYIAHIPLDPQEGRDRERENKTTRRQTENTLLVSCVNRTGEGGLKAKQNRWDERPENVDHKNLNSVFGVRGRARILGQQADTARW
ncbi:Uncharacterised protein [Chlamydia trachomatis]|nr:Uncharacterised protein [Chlamydia trachomatis]